MKVIILAAGVGKRLHPLTLNQPKCLVELFGKSILKWQADVFNHFNITDITVVKGYMEEKINIPNLNYYVNKKFQDTNMVETLFTAREIMDDSIVVSYGDIIFEKHVFEKLFSSSASISLIVDKNWLSYWKTRFKNPIDDAESLTINKNGDITNIGQKTTEIIDIQAQYIGLMKFQGEGLEILKSFYDKSKLSAQNGKNPLNSSLSFEKSFMTDLLQGMINDGVKIKAIPISNSWLELDSYNDFVVYKNMHEKNTLSKFFNISN